MTIPTPLRSATALVALLTFTIACDEPNKPEPAPKQTPTVPDKAVEPEAPTQAPPKIERRVELEPWRALLDETPRAELRMARDLVIDLGTADGFKYTRGGWQNRWEGFTERDGVTALELDGKRAPLDIFATDRDSFTRVIARVRSDCKDQSIEVFWGKESLGKVPATADWSEQALPLPKGISAGAHELAFAPAKRCKGKARAEFDWIALSAEAEGDIELAAQRKGPLSLDGSARRALLADTPRTYSFFLHVPKAGELVFDYGAADGETDFVVSVGEDGSATRELWRKTSSGKWAEGAVDLSAYSGKAVRLDLTTTAAAKGAGWGEIELMVPELPPKPASGNPAARPKNLVYVLIDTVRADVFEPFGGEGSEVKTPNFDKLSRDATVFSSAYANENWTKPSVATILSGLYPTSHDTQGENSTVPEKIDMLAERLDKAGFTSGAFIANGYVSRDFGFNQGWDYYTNFIREKKNTTAKGVYREAIQWVNKNHKKPFFLYVQTIDPHVPHRVDSKYTSLYYEGDYKGVVGEAMGGLEQADLSGSPRLTEDDYKWIRALYNGEVTYHDEHMGSLIARLEELGELDETLFIISHDHGEELNDHGKMGHRHTLYDELLRGPLLMRFPARLPRGHVVDDLVEYVDLAPTILELLGLEASPHHEGLSLVPLLEGRPIPRPRYVVSEFLQDRRALRVGRWKMVRSDKGIESMYDMDKDPGEQVNLVGEVPIATRMCHVYLGEALANPNKKKRMLNTISGKQFEAGEIVIEGDLKKQLEALGYFGGK